MSEQVERDERTVSIENSSYRWAYLVLSFGVLLSVAYRGFVHEEQAWDLMALVVLSGGIATLYQGNHRVLSRGWVIATMISMTVALLIGAVLVLLIVLAR